MMHPKGKHERPHNTSSVKQLSKTASTVHTYTDRPGDHCIYGTYVVLPVTEGLSMSMRHSKLNTWTALAVRLSPTFSSSMAQLVCCLTHIWGAWVRVPAMAVNICTHFKFLKGSLQRHPKYSYKYASESQHEKIKMEWPMFRKASTVFPARVHLPII